MGVDSLLSPLSVKHHLPIKAPISSNLRTRRTLFYVFGFLIFFVVCTIFFAFNLSSSAYFFYSSPWLHTFISNKSHNFPTLFSHFLHHSFSLSHQPNNTFPVPKESIGDININGGNNVTSQSHNEGENSSLIDSRTNNETKDHYSRKDEVKEQELLKKEKVNRKKNGVEKERSRKKRNKYKKWVERMKKCDIFDGRWVRDNSYPLFEEGSCPHIDEPFNCFLNGRHDNDYQKYRWQPNHCNIPRMNGKHMLKMLRGKRVVYVGDSLNRNMWESMICILRNAAKDKNKVFEASGREDLKTQGSYSFLFQDYNCTVEFFRSPFLVQEWEMEEAKGSKKETLRIDTIEESSDRYRKADVLIFNTGHWWTHEKTSNGKGYYQEGNHIHQELNVETAFKKALTTWANWVDANVHPVNTIVAFRGYSISHFRGGEWNSGGRCDGEREPLKEEKELEEDPFMVKILESVIKKMKTPVFYLNVTRMSNFRKDAHPSIYREKSLEPDHINIQDCSHWCLPGVPDTWNEILYSHIFFRQQLRQHRKNTLH